ncbi:hypothetical protein MPLA_750096 [Mesorhizobium sp. ORS 3359]|nr:hypothetical protein MPLA_750096 [Mesorhizobium sp. ORS 3359]
MAPGAHGAAGSRAPARRRNKSASGQAAARARRMRETVSVTRARLSRKGEHGIGELMGLRHRVAQGEHQPECGGVQDEANLISARRAAGGAVGGKLALVHLDPVLCRAAGAVPPLAVRSGAVDLERRHPVGMTKHQRDRPHVSRKSSSLASILLDARSG